MDDETYGMGGTLLKLANPELKNKIRIITFCSGLYNADEDRIIRYYNNLDNIRCDGVIIGYDDVTLETENILDLSFELNESIVGIMPEPDIIFTHTPNDIHKDHQIVSELVNVWTRNRDISVFHFFVGANTDWSSTTSEPNLFIDITGFEKDKQKLIKEYKTYPKNHPLSPKNIKRKDRYNGSIIGTKSAEVFEIKKVVL
jgi:LmbE family N-acetylglucosaminyl deacetylase